MRTWDDPKTVVALGAARMAQSQMVRSQTAQARHAAAAAGVPRPAAPPARRSAGVAQPAPGGVVISGGSTIRLEGVFEAHASAVGVYALGKSASGPGHTIYRIDRETLRPDRELQLRFVSSWEVSDEGLLVVDRCGLSTTMLTLSPELVIRSSRTLATKSEPRLVVDGRIGWAFYRPSTASRVDNSIGLPWGEVGSLACIETDLTSVFSHDLSPVNLRYSAVWFVNEDNRTHRLIDQESPAGSMPMRAVGKPGCVVVLGQYSSKAPFGATSARPRGLAGGRHRNVAPYQVICRIEPGDGVRWSEPRTESWVHQAVFHDEDWYLATTSGLEIGRLQGPTKLLVARPRAGALRWFPAGKTLYAVGMEQTVPSRGLWVAVLVEGELRTLLREPKAGLLGHLTSVYRTERPRIVVDGHDLLIGVSREDGNSSRVLRVTRDSVTEVHAAQGWLEPIAQLESGLLCLHDATTRPGTSRINAGSIVTAASR
ncbi:MAG: hypothetical protein JXA67_01950 [Micromonosporaceae bacterium]|nr:hypothetical protein [Micromonosporaceae bacterium]